jgi:hypothetical protein
MVRTYVFLLGDLDGILDSILLSFLQAVLDIAINSFTALGAFIMFC